MLVRLLLVDKYGRETGEEGYVDPEAVVSITPAHTFATRADDSVRQSQIALRDGQQLIVVGSTADVRSSLNSQTAN
jgi:hypothetical protein